MRISDWSSDVCSSDLGALLQRHVARGLVDALSQIVPAFHRRPLGAHEAEHHALTLRHEAQRREVAGTLVVVLQEEAVDRHLVEQDLGHRLVARSEEHTSELQSLMRISYAVFCLKKKKTTKQLPNQQ